MKKIVLFALLTTPLVLAGCSSQNSSEKGEVVSQNTGTVTESTPSTDSRYALYAPDKISRLSAEDNIILFFSAPWCPSCRTLDSAIKEDEQSIPENTRIFKVDYDSSVDLKKLYGVTMQHTFVQVDPSGNMITKWIGGSRLQDVLANIK